MVDMKVKLTKEMLNVMWEVISLYKNEDAHDYRRDGFDVILNFHQLVDEEGKIEITEAEESQLNFLLLLFFNSMRQNFELIPDLYRKIYDIGFYEE